MPPNLHSSANHSLASLRRWLGMTISEYFKCSNQGRETLADSGGAFSHATLN